MYQRLDFNHASDSCTPQSTPASRARHVHATCMPHACGVHAASYARHIMRTPHHAHDAATPPTSFSMPSPEPSGRSLCQSLKSQVSQLAFCRPDFREMHRERNEKQHGTWRTQRRQGGESRTWHGGRRWAQRQRRVRRRLAGRTRWRQRRASSGRSTWR